VRHRLTSKFLAYFNRNGSSRQIRLFADQAGIHISSPEPGRSLILWDRITRISGFKRDVYAHDLICLLIEQEDGSVLEINEGTPGWMELVKEIPIRLPAARAYEDWFTEVAFPAFDVSPANIFVRF
jgi:hypothetical protein